MSETREPNETVAPGLDPGDTVDLGDERYVRQRKRTTRAQENIRAQVVRNLMASVEGREWIYDLLTECHVYETSFSSDAPMMAFREGHRAIGIWVIQQIELNCREAYLQMIKEAKDRSDVRD